MGVALIASLALSSCAIGSDHPGRGQGSPRFTCKLPISSIAGGGFLDLNTGTFSIDSSIPTFDAKSPPPHTFEPPLHGYDAQLARWVPTIPQGISPDGRRYASTIWTMNDGWETTASTVSVTDVATGKRQLLWTGPGRYEIVEFTGSTIYLGYAPTSTDDRESIFSRSGLWALDASHSGTPERVGPEAGAGQLLSPAFMRVGDGAAWITVVDPNQESQILRVDLATGAQSTYYRGKTAWVWGEDDSSSAIVAQPITPQGLKLLLVSRNQTIQLFSTTDLYQFPAFSVVPGKQGIWIGGQKSILLLTKNRTMERITDIAPNLFSSHTSSPVPKAIPDDRYQADPISIAGDCI